MRKIFICSPNSLLSGGIEIFLKENSQNQVWREEDPQAIYQLASAALADVMLVEVKERTPFTIDEWNQKSISLKEKNPDCKVVYLVDEKAAPDLAERVTLARSDRIIDAFFHGSVSGDYLVAVINSL